MNTADKGKIQQPFLDAHKEHTWRDATPHFIAYLGRVLNYQWKINKLLVDEGNYKVSKRNKLDEVLDVLNTDIKPPAVIYEPKVDIDDNNIIRISPR